MIRNVNPVQPSHATQDVTPVAPLRTTAQGSPADRALTELFVCVVIALVFGTTVGVSVICTGMDDLRMGTAVGGATFGVVLGSLMVWRTLR